MQKLSSGELHHEEFKAFRNGKTNSEQKSFNEKFERTIKFPGLESRSQKFRLRIFLAKSRTQV